MKIETMREYELLSTIQLLAHGIAEKEHIKHHSDFAQAVLQVMNNMIYEFEQNTYEEFYKGKGGEE